MAETRVRKLGAAKIKLPPRLPFARIGLAGLGLIGGSLAQCLLPFSGLELYVYDNDPDTLNLARRSRRFAGVTDRPEEFLQWPLDLAYLCLPVNGNLELVELMGRRGVRYPVTDAGSTKAPVSRAAREAGLLFCGGHPIAGREVSGYRHAAASLIRGCLFILTPPEDGGEEQRQLTSQLTSLHQLLDCRVRVMTPEAHDRLYALVSHLPYLSASALAATVNDLGGEESLAWAGTGFKDSTRISAAAPAKWVEIIMGNADNLSEMLGRLGAFIGDFQEALKTRDEGRILEILTRTAAFRLKYPQEKHG